ncbi:helix-turn-helix domain-containing protein [Frondihabitans cladoniiphilus]
MPGQNAATELAGLRVIAHPLRLRLLSLLTGETLSAAEAARRLGESQANVSYHLRRLAHAGLVDLVETTAVRGGIAKRYRHDPDSGAVLATGDREGHHALTGAMAAELVSRSARFVPDTPIVFTDAEVTVPQDVWSRVADLVRQAGQLLSDNALPSQDQEGVRVAATLMLFQVGAAEPVAS